VFWHSKSSGSLFRRVFKHCVLPNSAVRLAVSNPSVPVGLLSLEEKLVELANLEEMIPFVRVMSITPPAPVMMSFTHWYPNPNPNLRHYHRRPWGWWSKTTPPLCM